MFLICLLAFAATACAHRILIIYPTASYSHQLPAMALTEALVKKGHEVFVLSPNAAPGLKNNYTFVDFSWMYKSFLHDAREKGLNLRQQYSKWERLGFFKLAYQPMMQRMFESDTFQHFYKKVKEERLTFDVVIVESYSIPYGVAASRLLTGNKPVITLATMIGGDYYGEGAMGNFLHLSYSPSLLSAYTDTMNLWERLDNWVSHTYLSWRMRNIMENSARLFFREKEPTFPGGEALVNGCWGNVSLSLIASNALYYYPRPMPPNVIEVGSLHIKTPEKLPKVLQAWLDGAEDGVVYFSLGSNMLSSHLPDGAISNLLKVFGQLPDGYRVLWKWENDSQIPGKSDNILTQEWLPQQSVLAHPKVKLFITQGGCQSFQEAVHYGVPTVGVPWFGDQEVTVAKMLDAGIGVRLVPRELSSYEKVKSAVEAVLLDERVLENASRYIQTDKRQVEFIKNIISDFKAI